jgi:isoleucyl-tRNA synthetase
MTVDYAETLFLPKTEFPMRGGLPQKEPEILARWARDDIYGQLRAQGLGRPKFVLHDGPPYANGHIHIGTALNKTLKDLVVRSQQMLGKDSNYVPGWDCHGLPIEWKVEEENYRSKGKAKPDFRDPAAMIAFRQECRAYAEHWLSVQREEFKRLGGFGDWDHPYSTMSFAAEAQIAREIHKYAASGLLYRGSKPVMWSVVEKTALAEAEVEYEDYTSDTVFVAFPVQGRDGESVVIWTTTPWTIPGNRAISYSRRIAYGAYRVEEAPEGNWVKPGAVLFLADALAESVLLSANATAFKRLRDVPAAELAVLTCAHPLRGLAGGYKFDIPLLDGDHVTDDAGTGFVHTAPSHGREDFEIWMASGRLLAERGIDPRIPYTVDENSVFTDEAPGFAGKRVLTEKGEKGDANEAVIRALIETGNLLARGKLKHQYPHSWRSKKPVIFRNTPQWFIAMDRPMAAGLSLRDAALKAIGETRWVPPTGENRIRGMVNAKPDWVMSRQRAWGVPIAVFVKKGEHVPLLNAKVNARIADAFEKEGADAWYAEGAAARFLQPDFDPANYEKIDDVLDVWFDSGSTHAFVLEDAEHFPGLAGIRRAKDGGQDEVMYLEGSDQHRGWFQASLLESCGTRGRAPFDIVLTHGFTLDAKGRKQSKSLGNQTFPQDIIKASGADILRLWVASADYTDDQKIGPEILKMVSDNYRKLRNSLRWMLGMLTHYNRNRTLAFSMIAPFLNTDLSAFYFDVRKDALYCEPASSLKRLGALETIERIFRAVTVWLAPILVFTSEEAWRARYPDGGSVHLELFPEIPETFRDPELAAKWEALRKLRSVVTGALEIARAAKEIGSSLEAAPVLYIEDETWRAALDGVDFAEVCIVSDLVIEAGPAPEGAFRHNDAPGAAVVVKRAEGVKCARSWRYFDPATADPEFPDVTPRDAKALREWRGRSA